MEIYQQELLSSSFSSENRITTLQSSELVYFRVGKIVALFTEKGFAAQTDQLARLQFVFNQANAS